MNIDSTMLRKMIAQQIQEYGDHETQARGGLVASSGWSDSEMDQVEDIALDTIEQGGSLEQVVAALEAEGFKVTPQGRVFYVDNKYVLGSPKDLGQDDQTVVISQDIVLDTLAMEEESKKDFVKQGW